MDLTDINNIRQILDRFHLAPSKSKGQNFLIDSEALNQMVEAAKLGPDDVVVEIGPGLGVLTIELAKRVKKVLAVELDSKAISALEHTLVDCKNVEILSSDILATKNQELKDKLGGDYKVVSNLPYNITGKVLRKFMSYEPRPLSMTLMLQKEVAERLVAPAGKMSVVAVSAQVYSQPQIMAIVKKDSFYPEPAVNSAVIHFSNFSTNLFTTNKVDEKKFWQLVKIGFSSRRKQLHNNLMTGLKLDKETVKNALIGIKIDPKTRAQDLSIIDWLNLAKKF